MSDTPTAECAFKTYWFWPDPPRLHMPAILEVRVWESGEHRVETPHNIYVHWECAGGQVAMTEAEESIITPEEFMRLKAADVLTPIGNLPSEVGELDISGRSTPPTAD